MNGNSLLGELAVSFAPHPENIATEALRYILVRHEAAWSALRRLLDTAAVDLPESLHFRTQAWAQDGTTPDLVGSDHDGVDRLLVEAKFWAGLTPNQPVAYLGRLPPDRPGALLFIAPGARFQRLWEKLTVACREAGVEVGPEHDAATELRWSSLRHGRLVLTSWRALLSAGLLTRSEGRPLRSTMTSSPP